MEVSPLVCPHQPPNISCRTWPYTKSKSRSQPWSTYAVHLTTLSHWALFDDCLLLFLFFKSTGDWDEDAQTLGFILLMGWMFMAKFIKLLGHYIRYPVDFLLLPISILFGYLHGLIKVYAMLSLNVVRYDLQLMMSITCDLVLLRLRI